MSKPAKNLSEKHREFVPLIAAIEKVEASVGEESPKLVRLSAESLHESLAHGLMPHAVGEGRTVFPVLRKITGTGEQALAMNRQHQEIARLTDKLERVSAELAKAGVSQERELRRLLHDLRGAVQEHFEGEEEACFSVLKAELDPDEARALCEAMERASEEIRKLYE